MFTEGWIDEVQSLLDAHDPPWSDTAGQSIGYQRLSQALKEGTDPFLEADKIIALNRALARSQLVWARKLPIEWFAPDEGDRVNERVQSALDAVKEGRPIDPPDRELMARRRTV